MAQSSISITVNGEAKEVEATTTGVELFSDDKNIIAVRLNGEPRDLYTPLSDGDAVEGIALDSEDGIAIMPPMSWLRPCRKSIPTPNSASAP